MAELLKSIDQPITEEMLQSWVGKYIHCPTNIHEVYDPIDNVIKESNAWFAGQVAGYQKDYNAYDFPTGNFIEAQILYTVIFTDGSGYLLSPEKCEVYEITQYEFMQMVEEKQKKRSTIEIPKEQFIIPEQLEEDE